MESSAGRPEVISCTCCAALKMPVVTTLHTVLREPDPDQLRVMEEIAELSDRLIVMSQLSSQFLQEIFKVPGNKIDMVPHGVPDLPFLDPNFYKDRFGVEGKAVLLTFGLLSPNKGIENVIQAMPQILSKHENVVYLVAGATHPHILRREGDKYRASLQALAKEVGVESQVIFHDRFVSPEEMAEFIGAADIYITPYRHEAQVVSGTLAYALGAGKAIISTPYWHAIELLDDRRGALVPFQDPDAIAQKTIELLTTPALRHAMRKRAYLFARDMVWKKAAQGYMESFARVRSDRMETPRVQFSARATRKFLNQLPELETQSRECAHRRHRNAAARHLYHPQSGRGIHHRRQRTRTYFYCSVEATGYRDKRVSSCPPKAEPLNPDWPFRYLAFLEHAFNPKKKRFRNFLGYDHRWMEEQGSEDSHGRALWALGTVLGRHAESRIARRRRTFVRVSRCRRWSSSTVRAPAPTLCSEFRSTSIRTLETAMPSAYDSHWLKDCSRCTSRFSVRTGNGLKMLWRTVTRGCPRPCFWWDRLAGMNACFPPDSILWNGSWKRRTCPTNGHFVPIGSQGFYRQGGEPARFDQQPIEAAGAVSACLQAYRVTGDHRWRRRHGRPSTGSWAITIFSFLSTILKPAVAGTACIPIAPIRIRERNPRCLS